MFPFPNIFKHLTSLACLTPISISPGRILVATRAIRKGELIFRECPAVVGPYARTPRPQCLDCFRLLQQNSPGRSHLLSCCQSCQQTIQTFPKVSTIFGEASTQGVLGAGSLCVARTAPPPASSTRPRSARCWHGPGGTSSTLPSPSSGRNWEA